MNKNHFNLVLLAALVSVIVLSSAWEFLLEELLGTLVDDDHEPESLSRKIEYVISITVFVTLSLIFPAMVGYKLIDNQDRLTNQIKRLSEEDYLTKLSNSTFAVILLDIDNFKMTNDSFGHNTGDRVLVQVADIINKTIRQSDIASRWGGEEFLIFCPHTNADGGFALAEKLRTSIEKNEFEDVGYKTASFGVTHIEHGDTVQSVIQRADEALYTAKNSGKNMVMAAT